MQRDKKSQAITLTPANTLVTLYKEFIKLMPVKTLNQLSGVNKELFQKYNSIDVYLEKLQLLSHLNQAQLATLIPANKLNDLLFLKKLALRFEDHQKTFAALKDKSELAILLIADDMQAFSEYIVECPFIDIEDELSAILALANQFKSEAIALALFQFLHKELLNDAKEQLLDQEQQRGNLKPDLQAIEKRAKASADSKLSKMLLEKAAAGQLTLVSTLLKKENGFNLDLTKDGMNHAVMRKALQSQNLELIDFLQKTYALNPEDEREWAGEVASFEALTSLYQLKMREEAAQQQTPKNESIQPKR